MPFIFIASNKKPTKLIKINPSNLKAKLKPWIWR